MTERGRLFGDAAIASQDPNLIVHIGRNNWDRTNPPISSHDIFMTWSVIRVKHSERPAALQGGRGESETNWLPNLDLGWPYRTGAPIRKV